MKNFPLVTFLIAILIILVVSCKMESSIPNNTNQRPNLLVGAASNLEYIFTDMGIDFEKQTGDKVIFAFGSSGNLARQLEHGAKFDLYASADPSYVEYLENLGLVIPEGSSIFAQGLLVAITFLGNEPHTSWVYSSGKPFFGPLRISITIDAPRIQYLAAYSRKNHHNGERCPSSSLGIKPECRFRVHCSIISTEKQA